LIQSLVEGMSIGKSKKALKRKAAEYLFI